MSTEAVPNTINLSLWTHATDPDANARLTLGFDGNQTDLDWMKSSCVKVEFTSSFVIFTRDPEGFPCHAFDHGGRYPDGWLVHVCGGQANDMRALFGPFGRMRMNYTTDGDMLLISVPASRSKIIRRTRAKKINAAPAPEQADDFEDCGAAVMLELDPVNAKQPPALDFQMAPITIDPAPLGLRDEHVRILARSALSAYGDPDKIMANKEAVLAAIALLS